MNPANPFSNTIGVLLLFGFIKEMDKSRRTLLFACFYAFFCNGLLALTQGSIMPDMKAAYGLSDTMGGVMLSAHSIGNLAAGFLSGLVGVCLGRKRTVILLSSLAFIGMLLIALFGAPGVLFMAFVLTGVGRGSVSNFNNGTVNAITGGNATASNLLHGVFAIGAITAPMAFLVLRNAISWRAGVIFVVICGAISVLNLMRVTVPDDKPAATSAAGRSGGFGFMKDPVFLVLGAMLLFYLCTEYAINGWLVSYIQHKDALLSSFGKSGEALESAVRAYSQSVATLLWGVILVGRLTCAWLSQKVNPRKLMLIASVGEALCFAGMLASATIAAVTLCVAGLGFCMSGICPMIYADAAWYTNRYPLATGMLLSIGSAGGIAMPTIVGALADRCGFGGGMMAILAALCLLVAFSAVNMFMKRKQVD